MGMKANKDYFQKTKGALSYKQNSQHKSKKEKTMPYSYNSVTPKEKFNDYSLDYSNPNNKGKAEAYEKGLGFTIKNSDSLIKQIHSSVKSKKVLPYDINKTEYGTKYKFRIPVKGPNGNTKNVIAVYQIDKGKKKPRLITNYLEGK